MGRLEKERMKNQIVWSDSAQKPLPKFKQAELCATWDIPWVSGEASSVLVPVVLDTCEFFSKLEPENQSAGSYSPSVPVEDDLFCWQHWSGETQVLLVSCIFFKAKQGWGQWKGKSGVKNSWQSAWCMTKLNRGLNTWTWSLHSRRDEEFRKH